MDQCEHFYMVVSVLFASCPSPVQCEHTVIKHPTYLHYVSFDGKFPFSYSMFLEANPLSPLDIPVKSTS